MALIIYTVNKEINVITKISLLLLLINISLYSINILSLLQHIELSNFLPLLKENTNKIFSTSIKISSINYLPLLTILMIPKEKISNNEKYSKAVIISYIIGAILSFGLIITTFGVLGIDLVNTFEYSEYIVLRKIKLFGFLERIENIVSLQWIVGSFIYLTVLIYTISKNIPIKCLKSNKIINIILGILLISITILTFKNNIIFDYYTKNILPYIISSLIIIYILLITKIFLRKKHRQ